MSLHVHSAEGADLCFGCKMAYMRQYHSLGVTYAGGREAFHNKPSVFQQERDMIRENTAKLGKDGFDRADDRLVDRQVR